MPNIAAVAKIEFPFKVSQQDVKAQAREMFEGKIQGVDRLLSAFDHTEIETRNFCKPLPYYSQPNSFEARNADYISLALDYSIQAITDCLAKADLETNDITDIVFVSTTGLATPSLDALIINKLRLPQNVNRLPLWGLGCGGGVSGLAKAATLAKANPAAIVLLVSVELCSLTLIKTDYSKSNFIGSSLFSDGVAAVLITGNQYKKIGINISVKTSSSKLYYDTLDIMGWSFLDDGFKVLFSKDIPTFIRANIKTDLDAFLQTQGLKLDDINYFIFHPGGTKVLQAYHEALNIDTESLANTKAVMSGHGNMSSATVLYVLEKFMADKTLQKGFGLMLAMGPGFSSEMVLLEIDSQ